MLKVLKFGGTSIETPERIRNIGNIIKSDIQDNCRVIIVVSAFAGITNTIINLANIALQGKESKSSLDELRLRRYRCLNELFLQKSTQNSTRK